MRTEDRFSRVEAQIVLDQYAIVYTDFFCLRILIFFKVVQFSVLMLIAVSESYVSIAKNQSIQK